MLWMWLLFFFLAFGAKVVLAVAMIYLMLEAERDCPSCAADTLPVKLDGWKRMLGPVSLGYVQLRWCPRCGWEGLTRAGRMGSAESVSRAGAPSMR
jgi:hypothetical protein